MRGDAALTLCLAGLAFSGLAAPNQALDQPVFGGQPVLQSANTGANQETTVVPTGDLLEFVDGSLMHGELKRMDTAGGLSWENPAALTPIDLQPGHIDSIRFAHAEPVTVAPTAHVRFANGDDLFGSFDSLNDNQFSFTTWFARDLAVRRAAVQSVTMLSSNYSILYEGPDANDDWIIENHNPESWSLVDGAFVSGAPGVLGRDFKLTGSATIEFDLSWTDVFGLLVYIYSDAADHLDVGNAYELDFTRDQINFRRADSSRQFPFRSFGSVPMPNPAGKTKVHVTIQANKQEGTVAVYIDNVLAKRWKDENGFSATGGGLLFAQTGMTGAIIKLSNFKISQWTGRFEPETDVSATNVDVIRFINHDQASGKITAIDAGTVTLDMSGTLLKIPLQRVTQINFASTPTTTPPRGPWEVRAHFPRGGSLSFRLEKWDDKLVSGRSDIFGPLAFQPGQIRQLEFNLDHPKAAASVNNKDFGGLDE